MRGSERRKYNGRTTEHDILTRRVAEVIEAATVLADHPDAAAARAALARVASEFLKARADTLIDRALKAAPSGAVAQTLQRAVEAASERVLICRNGARTELSLFAIPMIVNDHANRTRCDHVKLTRGS